MFELWPDTRTLVVICAFANYDVPPSSVPSSERLAPLERVEPTVRRLKALLSNDESRAAHIQTVILLDKDKATLLANLEEIQNALPERSNLNMVVFWSGHGGIPNSSFRLATRNTYHPIEYSKGIGLDEVMRQSGIVQVGSWYLLLDTCYSGEAHRDLNRIAGALFMGQLGGLSAYGACCSSSPYQKSRDSVFLETVVNLLDKGPSDAAKAHAAQARGGGGSFNPNNQLLTWKELALVLSTEFAADPARFGNAKPWSTDSSFYSPPLFPNPQFRANLPSRLVEDAYRQIARDADLEGHFFPKALGIENLESGWHFFGRVEATRGILAWMAAPVEKQEDRLYVLAADGGTGKSALLGRLISLTDPGYRAKAKAQGWNEAKDIEAGTVPAPDRIDAALTLRNLTPQTTAEHLANLLNLGSFNSVEDFVEIAANSYHRADGAAPCLVLDALDEATEPQPIVFRLIQPLVKASWKLLVATRRSARAKGANDLVADLGRSTVVELDQDRQSRDDIYAYTLGRLQPDLRISELAELAASLIADRADHKFLFARMATSSLLRRTDALSLEQLPELVAKDAAEALTQEVRALDRAFRLQFASDGDGATALFMALAWAEGDGVPIRDGIWAAIAGAVGSLNGLSQQFEDRHIDWLLREAGRFIQESGDGEQAVYRLFHKSLVDHFQGSPHTKVPVMEALGERIAMVLVARVRASQGWAYANPYLVRHMPAHLAVRPKQKELNELLLNFDWVQARLNLNGIQALLSDYRLCRSPLPATAQLHRTLSMIAHILRDHPDQLISQLLGRIDPGVPDLTSSLDKLPGAAQTNTSVSLNLLLERAKTSPCAPQWIPALGSLAQAGPLVYIMRGHKFNGSSVALSADGRILASTGRDSAVRLWDAKVGQPLYTFNNCQTSSLRIRGNGDCVAISADGRIVASSTCDSTVHLRLWDVESGQTLCSIQEHENLATCLALSADGSILASGSIDRNLRIWDTRSSQLLRKLIVRQAIVNGVAISADGLILAAGSEDGSVLIWDVQSGLRMHTIQGHKRGVTCIAMSADGRILVSGSDDNTVCVWDVQSGSRMHTIQGHKRGVTCVAISADGRILATGGRDSTVSLWDARTAGLLHTFRGHEGSVNGVTLSADGSILGSTGSDGTVRIWDTQRDVSPGARQEHLGNVNSMVLSSDGRTLVTSCGDDITVRIWDAQTRRLLRTFQDHKLWVTCVAISDDNNLLAAASYDKTVCIWDLRSSRLLCTLHGHEQWITSVAWSDDNCTLATASEDRTVRVWDIQSGLTRLHLEGHQAWVSRVALSKDGCVLASGSHDNTVRVWDARTGQLLHNLHANAGRVNSVALSNDGRTLVSACHDSTVRVWDVCTGQHLRTLLGHEEAVIDIALSADGCTLASTSIDRSMRLWNIVSGQCIETVTLDSVATALAWADQGSPPVLFVATVGGLVCFRRLQGSHSH